ncbi:MAG: hypothetical protein C4521_03305 [Actinobacteria bacterium]|nr:MAG: hypothetical protein C4521_03305 [Actinomycetota bacterium]
MDRTSRNILIGSAGCLVFIVCWLALAALIFFGFPSDLGQDGEARKPAVRSAKAGLVEIALLEWSWSEGGEEGSELWLRVSVKNLRQRGGRGGKLYLDESAFELLDCEGDELRFGEMEIDLPGGGDPWSEYSVAPGKDREFEIAFWDLDEVPERVVYRSKHTGDKPLVLELIERKTQPMKEDGAGPSARRTTD